jgi:hypothetical protein
VHASSLDRSQVRQELTAMHGFSSLNEYAQEHLATGCPVISADTKKKELATKLIPGIGLSVDHRDPWRQLPPLVMGSRSTDGRNQLGRLREAMTCLVRRMLRSFDE